VTLRRKFDAKRQYQTNIAKFSRLQRSSLPAVWLRPSGFVSRVPTLLCRAGCVFLSFTEVY